MLRAASPLLMHALMTDLVTRTLATAQPNQLMSSLQFLCTTMQGILQDLLPRILSLLEDTDDLARCSAVSKGYDTMSEHCRVRSDIN